MKNSTRIILTLLLMYTTFAYTQGSKYQLDFDGTDDYISLSTGTTNVTAASLGLPTNAITIEAWVNINTFGSFSGIVSFMQDNASFEHGIYLGTQNGTFEFGLAGGGVGITFLNTVNTYPTNQWHHIAATYDGTTMAIYVNGVLDVTSNAQTGAISYTPSRFRIGKYEDDDEDVYLFGSIDEVRIWDIAKSQAEIRTQMCKILTGSEAGLTHYWEFNEAMGTILTATSGGIDGTLTNMDAADWTLSQVPLGNASAFLYTNSWAGASLDLTSSNRGNLQLNTIAGNPQGVQIYRVDAVPNSTTGIATTIGNNNVYYGTFVIGGTNPSYTAQYDYNNYLGATSHAPNLALFYRSTNAEPTWTDKMATVDAMSGTLSKTAETSRGEYIITGSMDALPVKLLNFTIE